MAFVKGYIATEEHRKRNSLAKMGSIPWNKGLSINLNPETNFKKGHAPWNKGKPGYKQPEGTGDKISSSVKKSWDGRRKLDHLRVCPCGNSFKPRCQTTRFCSVSCGIKGTARHNKPHTPETVRKMSESMKGKKTGSLAYQWIEDRSKLKDDRRNRKGQLSRDWVKRVKVRDGYCCKMANQDCKGQLESHHILPWKDYPELRYEINNGITLCSFHHPRKRSEELRLAPYFSNIIQMRG